MEEGLPSLRKIKFKLVQPAIMCAGRDEVSCYYRGKVIQETEYLIAAAIKVHGQERVILYSKHSGNVLTKGFEDLVLVT
jgi:hypothetical protein